MRVVLDCDGVLLKWVEGYCAYNGFPKVEETTWDLCKILPLVGERAKIDSIAKFNNSVDFGRLSAFEMARMGVTAMFNAGYQVRVVSSCIPKLSTVGEKNDMLANRTRNLTRSVNTDLKSIQLITLGEHKIGYVEEGEVLVEDNPAEIERCLTNNVPCIALDKPYNRHLKGVMRASNLMEVFSLLQQVSKVVS